MTSLRACILLRSDRTGLIHQWAPALTERGAANRNELPARKGQIVGLRSRTGGSCRYVLLDRPYCVFWETQHKYTPHKRKNTLGLDGQNPKG